MRVRITDQIAASYDGMHVRVYEVGEEHDVGSKFMPYDMAESFIQNGQAEQTRPKSLVEEETAQEDPVAMPRPRRPLGPSEIKG